MLFTTSFAVNVIFFCRLNNCLILIRSFSFTKFKSKSTSQANSVTHPCNQTWPKEIAVFPEFEEG